LELRSSRVNLVRNLHVSNDSEVRESNFPLAQANNLVYQDGVWRLEAALAEVDFGYSDGTSQEQYLHEVIRAAGDRQSLSEELEEKIRDWPSEYHLSAKRANLLRGFDFSDMGHVLELGCGCGAITRYLGESGLKVDAVEGSHARALIAKDRCQDLQSVNVINANFNHLDVPARAYDAVFLIGVLEYASRFSKNMENDYQAAASILRRVKAALRPGGLVFVAIENRLGLKYLMGATEDHYGLPFIGIHDYPQEQGIKTYDWIQWHTLIQDAGYEEARCFLPFPDYKVPSVVISADFARSSPTAPSLLASVRSRDYLKALPAGLDESVFWRTACQLGDMEKFSNSYLWLLGDNADRIESVGGFDFAHLGGEGRKIEHRTCTLKSTGSDFVDKELLQETVGNKKNTDIVRQITGREPFYQGELLAEIWSRDLVVYNDLARFVDRVKAHYHFICQYIDQGKPGYDVLPTNIVVDVKGDWHVFDNEWQTPERVEPAFVLFRTLLSYCSDQAPKFKNIFAAHGFTTLEQFIVEIAHQLGLNLKPHMLRFAEIEMRIQQEIHLPNVSSNVVALLQADLSRVEESIFFHPKLYWAKSLDGISEQYSMRTSGGIGRSRQTLKFNIPGPFSDLRYIRFDPSEQDGYFHLYAIRIFHQMLSGSGEKILDCDSMQAVIERTELVNIITAESELGEVFYSNQDDPQLWITLAAPVDLKAGDSLEFQVEMDWPQSKDFVLLRNEYSRREEQLISDKEQLLEKLRRLQDVESEILEIKRSRVWRLAERFRRSFYLGFLVRFPYLQAIMLSASRKGIRHTITRLLRFHSIPLQGSEEDSDTPTDYEVFLDCHKETRPSLEEYKLALARLAKRPLISVVMPVYNVPFDVLQKAVCSVEDQIYENWELCIVDDCSTHEDTIGYLKSINHPRIKIRFLDRNRNISGATNAALDMASGEYIAFMDNDDELVAEALLEVVKELNAVDPDIIYSDEDFIDPDGRLAYPHFKPDFSPELLLSHNYMTHLLVVRRRLVESVGRLHSEFDGAQDYDLILRLVEQTDRISHIPKVLYHWRMGEQSTSFDSDAKPAAQNAARGAIEAALKRRGLEAKVFNANTSHFYRVRPKIQGTPVVSIVIPFKDKPELLRQCLESILEKSNWQHYEIIGISNNSNLPDTFKVMREFKERDSRIKFSECNIPFNFSHLVNYGASIATGDHLLLLNNDIKVISWDWIESMLELSQLMDIGVVGAKLYYPDNTVQHAGIIVGIGAYAGHAHKNFLANNNGYFNRLNIIQNVSAVTGACLMVKKTIFDELDGFDETELGVACNDVDFCIRVMQQGYRNVFTPYAELYHFESKSRGYEDTVAKEKRFDQERTLFQRRHKELLDRGDPYYNQNLSLDAEDFSLRM